MRRNNKMIWEHITTSIMKSISTTQVGRPKERCPVATIWTCHLIEQDIERHDFIQCMPILALSSPKSYLLLKIIGDTSHTTDIEKNWREDERLLETHTLITR